MSLLQALPKLDNIKKIISYKELTDFFKMLNEHSYCSREYDANKNRLDIWLLDVSFHGCQITISNVLGSSSITIQPFHFTNIGPSTTYMFDSFHFSKAMDTHLLTHEELMSKQQHVSEKKQKELRQKALKDAHHSKNCDHTTCEFCILEEGKRKKIEKEKFLEQQEQARKDALKNAHYLRPKTCDPNMCEFCEHERIQNYLDEQFAHEAKMSAKYGPYWREITGEGLGYT